MILLYYMKLIDSVFDCKTHFDYLDFKLNPRQSKRGIKTQFSEFLRVQPAFISQVLARKFSLSIEHADLANHFFDHISEESTFFILLVSRDRAGSQSLKKHYNEQINSILKKRLLITERLGKKTEVSDQAKGIYYSSWMYSGIHVGATIEGINSKQDLAKALNLPAQTVGQVLDFLVENNLLEKKEEKYLWTDSWIRLDKTSPHIIKHHNNWRNKAIQNLEIQTDEDLHYSGLFSMDQKTANKIKDQLIESIKTNLKLIEDSPERELYVLNADFFNLLKKIN